jgi:N-acetylneuraminate synthase
MSKKFQIDGKWIGVGLQPYVIAEISANHNGSIKNAIKLIELAKMSGADAVKIQTYKPESLTFNSCKKDFLVTDGLWAGHTLYSLYEWAQTPWEWHAELFEVAKKNEITIFSSPFDREAVDLLEDLNAPAYKIASFEVVDLELIRYAASTKKPLIISTGMATLEEIYEAVEAAKNSGCKDLAVLHCVSAYPAMASEYNLRTIANMIDKFNLPVGLSDHTLDSATAIGAVAMGATLIEKHFTLDRTAGGPDDSFSINPQELKGLCRDVKTVFEALGEVKYGINPGEQSSLKYRRSLYYAKNIKKGQIIDADCIKSVRPGYGLSPKYLEKVLGKKAKKNLSMHTAVSPDDIEF